MQLAVLACALALAGAAPLAQGAGPDAPAPAGADAWTTNTACPGWPPSSYLGCLLNDVCFLVLGRTC